MLTLPCLLLRSRSLCLGAVLTVGGIVFAVACAPQQVETSRRTRVVGPRDPVAPATGPINAVDYAKTVLPILKASCGTSSCHGPGSVYAVYDADSAVFLRDGQSVLTRLAATDDSQMPKAGFGMTLSDVKAKTLKLYLRQNQITDGTSPAGGTDDADAPGSDDPTTRPPSAAVVKVCRNVTAEQKAEGLKLTYADVRSIGDTSCGGAGCHSGALPRGFVPVESQWTHDTYGLGIVTNLLNGGMPIGGRTISEGDKAKIVNYICARKDF